MLLYVVFDTDSEYHMYFCQKPIFVDSRQETSAHFWTFAALIDAFPLFDHVLHFFSDF
jgi:hypothetical protein